MNKKAIKGVIFDLDGTLVDSFQAIYLSFQHVYRSLGLAPLSFEEVKKVIGLGLGHTFAELLGEANVPLAITLFREKYEEIFREKTHLLPGVNEVLHALQDQGIQMAVATNKFGRFARAIFQHLGLENLFTVILGDGDVLRNKPDPEMLFLAAARMGLTPDETVMVGDSLVDIETGRNAGMRIFAVPSGVASPENLETARPTVLLNRMQNLLDYV